MHTINQNISTEYQVGYGRYYACWCKCGCGWVEKDAFKKDLRAYVEKNWYQAPDGLMYVDKQHAADAAKRKAV